MVDIHHVRRTTDGGTVAIGGVVVASVELIKNQRGSVSADVLDTRQLFVGHEMSSGVARVGCQQHRRSTGDFLSDLIRVDVVVVILSKRDRDRSNLDTRLASVSYTSTPLPQ